MLKVTLILALAALTQGTWVIDWSDEFDGEEGWSPDGNKWDFDIGGDGWGNGELQYYTSDPRNAELSGAGFLHIHARMDDAWQYQCWYGNCTYTSARMITAGKFQQTYGRFEAFIKVPNSKETWPSFWMLGSDFSTGTTWPDCGEIDIMDVRGTEQRVNRGSIHGPGYLGNYTSSEFYVEYRTPFELKLSRDFHLFSVEWSPEAITWSVDEIPYGIVTKAEAEVSGTWVFDHEFFIVLNLAVGGFEVESVEDSVEDTIFPQTMIVDFVRVFHQE